jgi:hypothetical protein
VNVRFHLFIASKDLQETLLAKKGFSNMAILHIEKTFKINFDTIIGQFDTDSTERGRRFQLS